MSRKKFSTAAVLVTALSLVVTGCATSTTSNEGQSATDLSSQGSQINPQPASELQDGGDLRLVLSKLPEQWNYYHTDGALVDTSTILKAVMPRSFIFDENSEIALNTDFLTKAELVNSSPQTIEYQINDQAVWSDGTPITWKDYEAVWKALNSADAGALVGDPTGYQNIESLTPGATDKDFTVVFNTDFADWQKLFMFLYPAQHYATVDNFNTGWLQNVPVTAGPFKLTTDSINTTAQTVTLVQNEAWWGEKPKLDTITFRALESTADIDAYLNNEIDVVAAGNTDRYSRVKDAANTDIRLAPSSRYNHLTFGSGGVLADKDTRLAVQQAINRESLGQTIYNGTPYKFELLNNHMYLSTDPNYQDNATGIVDFDPAAAAAALDAAGWQVSGDVRVKDGVTLAPRMVIPSGTPVSQQIAELIQAQLAGVQVKLDIVAVPTDTFFRDNITPGNFDMTLFVWGGTGFLADGVSIYQTGENTQNYGKISTDEINTLLDQANAELNPETLAQLTNEADKLVWQEGHSLPIAQQPMLLAIRPGIANYGAFSGNAEPNWTQVGWMK
ncbi:ABC transporter family substrate-binding protein [Lysinibacter sp. HNR]|uniref:ABC transporter family substrate-binding protein n=1 Tax=Lysinibacter sp. HNR TaxID=3031408 RepID=UPI002434E436|nr:ABC transporter family substrate-binding protein [Lysinibacter sp. HNR]WGD37790.1 ABC transporter family substrate-binding protein [Lysinibacter sp. HNR]